jgi:hypothetical protein
MYSKPSIKQSTLEAEEIDHYLNSQIDNKRSVLGAVIGQIEINSTRSNENYMYRSKSQISQIKVSNQTPQ